MKSTDMKKKSPGFLREKSKNQWGSWKDAHTIVTLVIVGSGWLVKKNNYNFLIFNIVWIFQMSMYAYYLCS